MFIACYYTFLMRLLRSHVAEAHHARVERDAAAMDAHAGGSAPRAARRRRRDPTGPTSVLQPLCKARVLTSVTTRFRKPFT